MQQMKLSVIVPVYNAEKTLGRCLKSVLGSDMVELEVLCVNDGSTDGSAELLEEWKEKDDRITLIHQTNHGVSIARNAALREARGVYTVFVDADDEVTPAYFSNLVQAAEAHDAELVVCGYGYKADDGRGSVKTKAPHPRVISSPTPAQADELPVGVCAHLYKTEVLRKNGKIVGFPPAVRYGEDTAFHYSICPFIRTIVISEETGYIISASADSASGRASALVGDMVNALLWLKDQYAEIADRNMVKNYLVLFAAHTMRRIHALAPYGELEEQTLKLRKAMERCFICEQDLMMLSRKHSRRLINILNGGRGITLSYYFKLLKLLFRRKR